MHIRTENACDGWLSNDNMSDCWLVERTAIQTVSDELPYSWSLLRADGITRQTRKQEQRDMYFKEGTFECRTDIVEIALELWKMCDYHGEFCSTVYSRLSIILLNHLSAYIELQTVKSSI